MRTCFRMTACTPVLAQMHVCMCTMMCMCLHVCMTTCVCLTARVHVFAPYMHAHVCVCTIHACTHVFLSPRAAIPTCSHGPGKALTPALGQQAGRQRCRCCLHCGQRCLPPRPHLVAAEADVEVVEILEALGGEAGAAGKGRAGGQCREVVVQDLAWQRQGEAAVVVAEGAELGGGRRWQSGTARGWCHPAGDR